MQNGFNHGEANGFRDKSLRLQSSCEVRGFLKHIRFFESDLGRVWGWYGDGMGWYGVVWGGMGMVWGWYGDGMGWYGDGMGMVWGGMGWYGDRLGPATLWHEIPKQCRP